MVLLERLSSNNFENFKSLNIERFSKKIMIRTSLNIIKVKNFFLKFFLKNLLNFLYMGKKS